MAKEKKVGQRIVLTPAPRCQFFACCLREHEDPALKIYFENVFHTGIGGLEVQVLLEDYRDPRIEQTHSETDISKKGTQIYHFQPDQVEFLRQLMLEHGEIQYLEVITSKRSEGENPKIWEFDVLGFCTIELEKWKRLCQHRYR